MTGHLPRNRIPKWTSSSFQQKPVDPPKARSDASDEDVMVTSDDEEEEEEEEEAVRTPGRGLGKSAAAPWSRDVAQMEPLFLPDPDEPEEPTRKRVLQDSPSRVVAVAKRSRKAEASSSVDVPEILDGVPEPIVPPPTIDTIDLGHLTVENDTPITDEYVPGLGAIVSKFFDVMLPLV